MRAVRKLGPGAVLAAVLATAPSAEAQQAPAAEPEVVRYPPSSVRPKLVIGGVAIFGLGYGAAFLGAEATSNWPGTDELKVPVIGPWWSLALNGCPANDPGCDAFVYLRAGLLVVDGLIQAAGLALVAEAIVMKTEATPAAPAKPAAAFTWHPAPFVTPNGAGFGFVGTF